MRNKFDLKVLFVMAVFIFSVFSLPFTVCASEKYPTYHKTIDVNGVEIFYREAGNKNAPTILLLHG